MKPKKSPAGGVGGQVNPFAAEAVELDGHFISNGEITAGQKRDVKHG